MGTITKSLEMLNCFSRSRPEIGLADFVRLTGRDKATVHRHLTELERNGFVERHPHTRAYRLGAAVLRLSAVREAAFPLRSVARPIVDDLAREVGELVHFSQLQGQALSPVHHADPQCHGTRVAFDEAELLPLHATASGLAVLAFAPSEFVERVLAGPLRAYASGTVTDTAHLRKLIAEVREAGFSRLDQGFDAEVASHGAPIFGPNGTLVGALAIAVPRARMTEQKSTSNLIALGRGMTAITRAIGGAMPPEPAAKWTPHD